MASISETGHAKNIANFQALIEFVKGYGPSYNPSKTNLQLPALTALKESAELSLAEVLSKSTMYHTKVSERQEAFSKIKTLATRLLNSLEASDASEGSISQAKTYNRKLQGKRASASKIQTDPNVPVPATISTSQQSFDQIIQHLSGLKTVLQNEPNYRPNEQELSAETLTSIITDLQTKNTAVDSAYVAVSNQRIARDWILYNDENNICQTALDIKKYIKAVFGATSPQFLQVKSLEFAKIKA